MHRYLGLPEFGQLGICSANIAPSVKEVTILEMPA
jgi:hypothetical protein